MYCTFALFSIFSLYFYFYYKRFVTFWQKLFESTKILSNWNKILTFISKIKCRTFIEHFIAIFYWVWKTFWYLPCLELLITKNRFYKVVKRGHCISNCFKIYSFHKLNDKNFKKRLISNKFENDFQSKTLARNTYLFCSSIYFRWIKHLNQFNGTLNSQMHITFYSW